MSLAVVEILILSTSLLVGRNVFGHVFSSDKETIDYVAKMAPLVSISLILDGLQGVLSGSRLVPISVLKHKLLSDIVYPLFLQSLLLRTLVLCQSYKDIPNFYSFLTSVTLNSRLMVCRYCKGMRMATYRSLHKLRSFLSLGDTHCCIFSLLDSSERCWPLDWNPSRCRSANASAYSCHGLHKLGKPGPTSFSFFSSS